MPDPARSSSTHKLCANCGGKAGPRFCPHCGQEVEARHGPLLEVGREFVSEWLSLDSKLLRSLGALLRPGRLSELYLGGKRAPFLRPFRLYLLASIVLFSTVLTLEAPEAADYEVFIGGQRIGSETPGSEFEVATGTTARATRSLVFLAEDNLFSRALAGIAGDRIGRLRTLPREQVLDTLFTGLRRLLPLAMVLFLPLLALGLKLLYIRRRALHHLYIDHLVFAIHLQAALFFALSATWLVSRLAGLATRGNILATAAVLVAILLVYLPWALRRFYGQSRLWTAVKAVAVLYLYSRLVPAVGEVSALVAIWGA